MLVLAESEHQSVQDEGQVGNQLRARLLLQRSEGTGCVERVRAEGERNTSECLRGFCVCVSEIKTRIRV